MGERVERRLAASAAHVLVVAKESPSFFGSLVGALSVSQALVAALVARGGAAAIDALDTTERHLDAFEVYWEEAAAGGTKA